MKPFLSSLVILTLLPGVAIGQGDGYWSSGGEAFVPLIVVVLLVFALAPMVVWAVRRFKVKKTADFAEIADQRDWPSLVARASGRILHINPALKGMAIPGDTANEVLETLFEMTGPEIYRLSRLALNEGLGVSSVNARDGTGQVALVAQLAGAGELLWQGIPRSSLPALYADGGNADYDSAPFAYVHLHPVEGTTCNALFRDKFTDEAADMLREQVDNGVFVAGRIVLPGTNGTDCLALSASRVERTIAGDSHEIFLFVPDGETSGQVSAAETLEALPVSLLQLNTEGQVLWANNQAREMLGDVFAPGRNLTDMLQPLGRSLDSLREEVLSGVDNAGGEMVRLRDDAFDTFAQVNLTRMTLQGQPSLMAVLTDASELRLLEDKFAQSQKMEAVGKLAGGVAHDFNNVLTAISGNCDLLLLRKDASHPDFSDLTQIRQNSNRAATLVRQLLAFSRKQTLQPKLLSVQDVVSDTLYLLDRLIGETITLSLEHQRDLGSVRADNQQLEQALMNLVVNARDAMPDGGVVTIATGNKTLVTEEQKVGVSIPAGEYVQISVSDEGSGIDPQVIDKVFDPFFTTKAVGEGTGLGLSTVYGIVKQSGGYIYAENKSDGGAEFTVLLPRAYPETALQAAAAAPVDTTKPDLTGHGAVLLVEDEAPVRSFASRALKLRGYRVLEAECAEDAMDLLSEGGEDVDVLVSDVVMPGMDGPTFAGKAREMRPDLRVIFISGYAEDSFRRNLTEKDFLFLPKPFSLNELTATVKIAMDQGPKTH